jgi:hypothetical protein
MHDPFVEVLRGLHERQVRFVLIGVWGANYYSPAGSASFRTRDRKLFLPPDPLNLLRAWEACEAARVSLWAGNEPLDRPRTRNWHVVSLSDAPSYEELVRGTSRSI